MQIRTILAGTLFLGSLLAPGANLQAKEKLRIPPGHLPPAGQCRIWFPDRPPGHQPPPGDCRTLSRRLPRGAFLIARDRRWSHDELRRDSHAHRWLERYAPARRDREIRHDVREVRKARAAVARTSDRLEKQRAELRRDRAELRDDIREGAGKREIRRDRREIRMDREKIADTREDLRESRERLDDAREQLRDDSRGR
jgi:hypothetical protein